MPKRPWSKFYWADWRADPRLRMCSLAARGLWVELCGLAHEAEPYGHVLVDSMSPTPDQMAMLAGAPRKVVVAALAELETAGVFSRTDAGVIYSRRMVRDREREEEGREAVSRRWANSPPNRSPNRPPTDPPITPEARSQKLDETPNGVSPAQPSHAEQSDGRKPKRKTRIPADWRPSASGVEFAGRHGFGPAETERIAQRFRDHWLGKGESRADWDASFRTWIGNEIEFRRGRGGAAKPDLAEQQERDRAGILAALAPEFPARQ